MNERLRSAADALRARGFIAEVFDTANDAADYVCRDVPAGADVAIGGSMTVRQMDLHTRLREEGHTVLWHWDVPFPERHAVLHKAMGAPAYICSANALTDSGLIVQIDGTGNRVGLMCYGPETVYVLVGKNKLVEGSYAQAVARIKQVACPQNARRLGYDTPCAAQGRCDAAACTKSMCSLVLALERASGGKTTKVLLIDEELGY